MRLEDVAPLDPALLPVAALADHLRLGTGFADDGSEAPVLESCLRAALAEIEGRTGKVLIERQFRLIERAWRSPAAHPLPVAPVRGIAEVTLIGPDGTESPAPAASWRLEDDEQRPRLVAAGAALPAVPAGGAVRVVMLAGYAPVFEELPADLAQAVLLLAAARYDARGADAVPMPRTVAALIERYRVVRVMGAAS
ncbi:MAG: hypothetical protein D6832_02415 [Alphaproteobacteria bacterium]|nr:MAG: hypothetical protein D6832_02415 [Alphaproteobacteria bacterium]